MTLSTRNVGRSWGPVEGVLEPRRTMAYAAGIGDDEPSFYDTTTRPLPVHPLYPVCPEWSLLTDEVAADEPWSRADASFGVHAAHDLILHRALHAGTGFALTATVVSLEQRRSGAYQVLRFDARDAQGNALWTSWNATVFRGVGIEGQPTSIDATTLPVAPEGETLDVRGQFAVTLTDAHVYSECARIWNPIHTDVAIARQAGLDGVLLHGTATLARAVTHLSKWLDIRPGEVRRVACRFASPARPGDLLSVRAGEPRIMGSEAFVDFDVLDADGREIVRHGVLEWQRSSSA